MSDYQTLLWEPHGAVLRLTCHRPQVLNAQSRVMIEELDAALARAAADDAVRVIIIAGAGKHFSAGHDLGTPEEIADRARRQRPEGFQHELQDLSALYLETCLRWHEIPKPTIAQVQGYCIMGGLMLASCCDLIVAADDAQFADRSVRWEPRRPRRAGRSRSPRRWSARAPTRPTRTSRGRRRSCATPPTTV
jgi:enoyl-CoA hydratase